MALGCRNPYPSGPKKALRVLSATFKLKEKARTNKSIEFIFTELFGDPKGFLLAMAN